ncbi:MAG TPA: glycosyltransferase family 39 protein, partial [Candidatus Binataceae bacterium]|nr:glycosyltransferase family 39 protein [Candidatus Binataceae bacterium]
MLNPAMGFAHDWNPHFSIYPAAQMYVQHFALLLYARAHGQHDDFREFYQGDNYPTAHLVARGASATLGAATVPAIYYAAAPVFGAPAGLAAAAIVTFSSMHVLNSKFATTDVGAVFWLTLAIAMILRIAHYGRYRDYVLAAVFAGIATATKYPAGAIVFGIAAAHLGYCRRTGGLARAFVDPRIYLAGVITFLAFFFGTPYTLLDWS